MDSRDHEKEIERCRSVAMVIAMAFADAILCQECPARELCSSFPRKPCSDLIYEWALGVVDKREEENDE